jgi:hypothetical protein
MLINITWEFVRATVLTKLLNILKDTSKLKVFYTVSKQNVSGPPVFGKCAGFSIVYLGTEEFLIPILEEK